MSRRTNTPSDLARNKISPVVIVREYIAPLSMTTRRTLMRTLPERYCADLRATVQILSASSPTERPAQPDDKV